MKPAVLATLSFSLLFVSLAAVCAGAQLAPARVNVSVPFAFNLASREFPAGSYGLAQIAPHYLALRDARGRTLAYFATNAAEARNVPEGTKLVFRIQDGQYFLTEIWRANDTSGEQIPSPTRRSVTLAGDQAVQSREVAGREQ